jgi:CRP-like cAMP-binding protein
MALDDDIRVLSGVGLLKSLNGEQLRLLAFGAENMHLHAERELFRPDTLADCAYVVRRGSLTTFRMNGGERRKIATITPGDVLDEMALIVDVRRSVGAYAEEETDVLRINRTLFRRILEEYPDVAVALHEQIAERFTMMADRIVDLKPRFND